jgi:hypothetical protein
VTARFVPMALTDTGPPSDHIKMDNRELGHVTGETNISLRSSGSEGQHSGDT